MLRANAKKEAMIAEAEGKAQATERLYEAQARGIEMIKNADPNRAFLTLKSLETYGQMADGKATKIIVPGQCRMWRACSARPRNFCATLNHDRASPGFLVPSHPFPYGGRGGIR